MTGPATRRGSLIVATVGQVVITVTLSVAGWGGWAPLVAHPARAAFVGILVLLTLVALASPVNLSSGEREDVGNRRIFVPTVAGVLVLTWLMPFMDRRDLWALDGDAVRYAGLALLCGGGVLRVWPMFVLGGRFSGLVAIQPGHQLVTTGPYRLIRHPSYLGMMLMLLGWALVFRSSVGVLASGLGCPLLHARIASEEALLASQFGRAYEEYRWRTWRLLPGLY